MKDSVGFRQRREVTDGRGTERCRISKSRVEIEEEVCRKGLTRSVELGRGRLGWEVGMGGGSDPIRPVGYSSPRPQRM